MREFSIPEGENGLQQAAIDWIHLKGDRGYWTWLRGFRYPFYGFPLKENVMSVAAVKQMLPVAIKLCFNSSLKFFLGFLFLFFPRAFNRLAEQSLNAFLSMAFNSYQYFLPAPEKYTRPIREIYRVLTALSIADDWLAMKGRIERLRDVGCVILQYDNAYVLRLQDGFNELDSEKFKKDPVGELRRIMTIVAERDVSKATMTRRVKWMRDIGCMFLKRNKDYYALFVAFVNELKLENIRFDEAEKYYCRRRNDYDFEGHRKKRNKKFGLPNKEIIEMENIILQRIESRKTAIQQEFDRIVGQRDGLVAEERRLEERKEQVDNEIKALERKAENLRGRYSEVMEEDSHLKQVQEQDKKSEESK